jgi:hypothetical protein
VDVARQRLHRPAERLATLLHELAVAVDLGGGVHVHPEPLLDALEHRGQVRRGHPLDAVLRLPRVEDPGGRPERDRGVDHGGAAETAPLEDRDVAVDVRLPARVHVEPLEHVGVGFIELAGGDVGSRFQQDHLLPRVRQLVGHDGAAGPGADDHDVGGLRQGVLRDVLGLDDVHV